jgi:hypothetical protein
MIYQQTRRWLDAGCFEIMVDEDCVELAYVDQGYTGEHAAQAQRSTAFDWRSLEISYERRPLQSSTVCAQLPNRTYRRNRIGEPQNRSSVP